MEGTILQLERIKKSRDLTCSMRTMVKSSVMNTGNLLRVDFRCSHHTHTVTV